MKAQEFISNALLCIFYFVATILVLVLLISLFLFGWLLRAQETNVSKGRQYVEVYGQTFELQQDLFIHQGSDSKEWYFSNWEASDAIAKVERGTKIHVKKIILQYTPFVGTSLKIFAQIQDSKFSKYNSIGVDAGDLAINYLRLPSNGELVLFDPDYLRNIDIGTLHLAAQYGDLEAVKSLLKRGADINQKNLDEKTPLHYAKDLKIVEYLVEKGAEYNHTDKWEKTLLHYIVKDPDYLDIVKFLIEKGAYLDQQDEEKNTPLHIAAYNKNYDIVEAMLNAGADPFVKGEYEETILLKAAEDNKLHIVELSLKLGADPLALCGLTHKSALHFAIRENNIKMAKLLLEAGVPVNGADDRGKTPLHMAVSYGDLDIVRLLLDHGANVNQEDREGISPIDLAEQENRFIFIRILKKHKLQVAHAIPSLDIRCKRNSGTNKGCTLLMIS